METNKNYTTAPHVHTCKNGRTMNVTLVTLSFDLTDREKQWAEARAEGLKGWYAPKLGGYILRKPADVAKFIEALRNDGIL